MPHTNEDLNRAIDAVKKFNAPWITDITDLNQVFQAACELLYGNPTPANVSILRQAVVLALSHCHLTEGQVMSELPGDWICLKCGPILNECVTFEETCTHCRHPVFWVEETHELIKKSEIYKLRTALEELAKMGEEGIEPDYQEWLTFHDKVAQIARQALAKIQLEKE